MTGEQKPDTPDWREAAAIFAGADVSGLAQGAVTMHELWGALKAAGFPRYEAMWLTAALCSGITPPAGWQYPETP